MDRIVIAARGYNEAKGGHIVLHKLCDSLLREGLDTVMMPHGKHWATCPRYIHKTTDTVQPKTDFVVYHNTITGNPWKAKHFARWMLYTPTRDRDGVILYYSKQFGPGPYLNVTDPRLDVFYDRKLKRKGVCWTYRKAHRQKIESKNINKTGTEIPRGLPAKELADIFSTHERFICYDGASFLAVQAALCGCDVIVPNPVGGTFPYEGIATCESEIDKARSERDNLRQRLEREFVEQDKKAAEVIQWAMNQSKLM